MLCKINISMSQLYALGAGAAGLGLNSTAIKMPPASAGGTKGRAKYKKAPGAPKRFKSAFIFFSTAKHKEIRKVLGEKGKDTEKVCLYEYSSLISQTGTFSPLLKRASLAHLTYLHVPTYCIDYQRGQARF
jgi:hypothetical protein